jgi:phosphoribosylformylglycinamidine synthase
VQSEPGDHPISDIPATLLDLLADPGIGSSDWIHTQYDHMLFLNTVVGPGADGTLLRVRGTEKALAVSTDGNGRLCYLDPRIGSARIVYEAALNVAVMGAKPLAVVDNLNFGNPEKPEVMWQFKESVEGISQACETLEIPVVGGNVSFYNESGGVDINPTPVVGLLGLADPMPAGNLAASAVQRLRGSLHGMPTPPDADVAKEVVALAAELAHIAPVLHDISNGGLAVALAEICIASDIGARVQTQHPFSEDPHRFLVVASPGALDLPVDIARRIGVVGGGEIEINGAAAPLADCADIWHHALKRALNAS